MWPELNRAIENCNRCKRLRQYCEEVARIKKREFKNEPYWGKPVVGFGDPKAKLWIVGLAPAAHGANRTGRMFTGDSSGRWLYKALYRVGLASSEESKSRADGLKLSKVFISSAVRCAPPDNKPLPAEKDRCAPFLDKEYALLRHVELFLALGSIGFRATLDLLEKNGVQMGSPKPKFQHGGLYQFGKKKILVSYHPSRQNTQTGKLTEKMWNAIFEEARELLGC